MLSPLCRACSSLLRPLISRSLTSAIRRTHDLAAPSAEAENWIPIYRFRKIRHILVVNRLKIYMTIAITSCLPYAIVSVKAGNMSYEAYIGFLVAAGVSCLSLILVSFYTRRLVGVISIQRDLKLLRVGHMTFWGRRKNVFVDPESVEWLSDYAPTGALYAELHWGGKPKEYLVVPLVDAEIVDRKLFEDIFGILPHLSERGEGEFVQKSFKDYLKQKIMRSKD